MRDEKLHNSCISWLLNWANTNKPDMILIYGSYLRRKESHDIDVLIVSDEFCSIDNKKRRELIPIPDIYQDLFDILLMSSYEWKKNIEVKSPLSTSILQSYECIFQMPRRDINGF